MTYTATVTSQGQVSIPAPLRRKYRLDRAQIIIEDSGTGMSVKPVPDIMSLAGIFKTKKRLTREQEREVFVKSLVARHKRK